MVASGGCGDCVCNSGAPCDDRVRVTDLDLRFWIPGGRVAAIASAVGRSSTPPNLRRMLDPARAFWGTQLPLPRLAAAVPGGGSVRTGSVTGGLGGIVAVSPASGCAFDAGAGGQLAQQLDQQLGAQGIAEAVPVSGARKRAGDLVATSDGGVAESEGGDPDAGEDEADALDDLIDALGGASGDDVVDQGPHRVHALVDSYLTDVFGGCPIPVGPTMTIPPLYALDLDTQGCLLAGSVPYGTDGCCPPPVAEGPCALAGVVELIEAASLIQVRPVGPDLPFDGAVLDPALPAQADIDLLVEALAVLRTNRDVVKWALCLAETYSPAFGPGELSGGILDYIDGVAPLHFTFISTFSNPASAGAFTEDVPASDGSVGLIIAAGAAWWVDWRARLAGSGEDGFCVAVAAATILLHELVHVRGDRGCVPGGGPGACHGPDAPPWPCWDETRMVDSAFQFAMSQRFPCLADGCCAGMGSERTFLFSGTTSPAVCAP